MSDSVSKMLFVASLTYVRNSLLWTVRSNSCKLTSSFLKRCVRFPQQRPILAQSLSGSNRPNDGTPLCRSFALVLVLLVLKVAPCGGCVPGAGRVSLLSLIAVW